MQCKRYVCRTVNPWNTESAIQSILRYWCAIYFDALVKVTFLFLKRRQTVRHTPRGSMEPCVCWSWTADAKSMFAVASARADPAPRWVSSFVKKRIRPVSNSCWSGRLPRRERWCSLCRLYCWDMGRSLIW